MSLSIANLTLEVAFLCSEIATFAQLQVAFQNKAKFPWPVIRDATDLRTIERMHATIRTSRTVSAGNRGVDCLIPSARPHGSAT